MATTSIRDVTINVRLKQHGAALRAPGLGGQGDVAKQNAREEQREREANLRESLHAVKEQEREAVRAARQVARERVQADKQTAASARQAARDRITADKEAEREHKAFTASIVSGLKEQQRSEEQAANVSARVHNRITAAGVAAASAFQVSAAGAFQLARGVAFMSAQSDADLQKVIRALAGVQGAFDLFRGGINVVKGITAGIRQLQIASALAAAAQRATAAANVAVGTTAAVSTPAVAGLGAVLTPLLPIIGGITLAVGALAAAWLFFRTKGPDYVKLTSDALNALNSNLDIVATRLQRLQDLGKTKLEVIDIRAAAQGVTTEQHLAAIEKERLEKQKEFTRQRETQAKLAKVSIADAERAATATRANVKKLTGIEFIDSLRGAAETHEAARIAELAVVQAELQAQKAAQQAINAAEEADLAFQQRKGALLKEHASQLESNLRTAQAEVDTARNAVKAEEDRLKTVQQRLGLATAGDARRLKAIRQQVKVDGEESLSRSQIERLRKFGVGTGIVQRFDIRRAERLGLDTTFLEDLEGERIKALEVEQKQAGDNARRIDQAFRTAEQQSLEQQNRIADLIDKNIVTVRHLNALEDRLKRLFSNQQLQAQP